jgi:hypothetical protein
MRKSTSETFVFIWHTFVGLKLINCQAKVNSVVNIVYYVRSEFLTVVAKKIALVWDVTMCSVALSVHKGPSCLHH